MKLYCDSWKTGGRKKQRKKKGCQAWVCGRPKEGQAESFGNMREKTGNVRRKQKEPGS